MLPAEPASRPESPVREGPSRPRLVVIGAGFAGLACVRALRRSPVDITLIDRRNYHLFQPLLYQVATAGLSPADIAWPIRGIFAGQANVRVEMGRVVGVDVAAREVVLQDGRRRGYDWLVLGTGARHSYFGRDEWEVVAPGLKKIADATRIRERVLLAFEKAEMAEDPAERDRLLTMAVIGAGPTGVEMAGALAELARHALAADFRSIDPRRARIVLVEAGPRVLAGFPEVLSDRARAALERLGVEVMVGNRVTVCDARGLDLASGRLEAGTVIWAAGVVASPAAGWLDAAHDRVGRVEVAPDLSVPGHPEIFVVGDTALVRQADGSAVPGIAPAAKQMGGYVGKLIDRRLRGKAPPPPFAYRHQGNLATIGRRAAVADIRGMRLSGSFAWLLWAFAHIYFLIGWRNRLIVSLNWLWSYLTFERGARLITTADFEDRPAEAAPAAEPKS